MKLIHGILGGALAAGLIAFGTGQAQASDVIDDVLYLPLNIKASVTFDVNGKNKKVSLTNKILVTDLLQMPSDTKLAVSDDTGDVWAFGSGGSEDLTTAGILTISNSMTGQTVKGAVETDTGTTEIDFYDNPQFDIGGLDKVDSENNSGNWFEINGTYSLKRSEGAVKNGLSKISDTYSAKDLSGTGLFDEVENSTVPITGGSATAKGSGLILP